MKVEEIMDKEFILVSPEDDIREVSLRMEKQRKFTAPVVDEKRKLLGWITSLDVARGLREGQENIFDIMHFREDIISVSENVPARLAVLEASQKKVISIPVMDEEGIVMGVVRTFDIVETLSQLYEIKVYKIFKAMNEELKGINWEELMEAAAIVTTRRTGKRTTAEEYEQRIKETTFGEAIWATGGLEKFLVDLIAIGELVIARKVSRARD